MNVNLNFSTIESLSGGSGGSKIEACQSTITSNHADA